MMIPLGTRLKKLPKLPAVGDVVLRVWGNFDMKTELRVSNVDDEFIYCDAQRNVGDKEWSAVLGPDDEHWMFDTTYGVETDLDMGWGIATKAHPKLRNIVLTRLVIEP